MVQKPPYGKLRVWGMCGLSEQVLNSLVSLGVATHPFWGVGNGVQGELQLVCAESYTCVCTLPCLEKSKVALQ